MILGVAFVWFTTHFGGGFASGAQIYSYYVRYGIWCLIMPAAAMLYNTVFFAYCLRFARKHEVYDYRSYNNAFYGKFSPVFSNLFEILYLCVMCVAPAVAFATGGATLSALTGLPYLLCTFVIGVFIFIVDLRNGSCPESGIGAFRLHHRGTSDRVYSEHRGRLRRDQRDRSRNAGGAGSFRESPVLRISLWDLPVGECGCLCPACEVL